MTNSGSSGQGQPSEQPESPDPRRRSDDPRYRSDDPRYRSEDPRNHSDGAGRVTPRLPKLAREGRKLATYLYASDSYFNTDGLHPDANVVVARRSPTTARSLLWHTSVHAFRDAANAVVTAMLYHNLTFEIGVRPAAHLYRHYIALTLKSIVVATSTLSGDLKPASPGDGLARAWVCAEAGMNRIDSSMNWSQDGNVPRLLAELESILDDGQGGWRDTRLGGGPTESRGGATGPRSAPTHARSAPPDPRSAPPEARSAATNIVGSDGMDGSERFGGGSAGPRGDSSRPGEAGSRAGGRVINVHQLREMTRRIGDYLMILLEEFEYSIEGGVDYEEAMRGWSEGK